MKGLLKNDFYVNGKIYLCYYLFGALWFYLSYLSHSSATTSVFQTSMTLGLVVITLIDRISEDYKTKWSEYVILFPLKREVYVKEKYLLGMLNLTVIIVLGACIGLFVLPEFSWLAAKPLVLGLYFSLIGYFIGLPLALSGRGFEGRLLVLGSLLFLMIIQAGTSFLMERMHGFIQILVFLIVAGGLFVGVLFMSFTASMKQRSSE